MIRSLIFSGFLLLVICNISWSKPVRQPPKPVEGNSKDEEVQTGLEYDRYLREVVSVLEEDEDFRKKLETANVSEIKDGSIARNLEFVSNHIRTKLDELKRREIDRLQELARVKMRQMKGAIKDFSPPSHLDVMNPHSFEMKDLENLIKKTTHDLEELDKQRQAEFKEYEMEKQYEQKEKLSHMNEEERKKEEARLEELKQKHNKHEKLNHPASKDQFEEVWENQDHLDKEDFEPRTFFNLHDTNSDGIWGMNEVEALLITELDKAYGEKNPEEDDPVEREEEMHRMRKHIMTEIDTDKDGVITKDEFLAYTGPKGDREEFEKNEEWKTLDSEDIFNNDEYENFVREHHQQQANIPVHPNDPNVQNMQINPNMGHQQVPLDQANLQYQQQQHMAQQQAAAQMVQQQAAAMQQAQMAQQQLAQQQAQMAQAQLAQHQAQAAQQLHQAQQGMNAQQGFQGQAQQPQGGLHGQAQQQQGLHGQQQVNQHQGSPQQPAGQVPVQNIQPPAGQVPVQNIQPPAGQVPVQNIQQQVPVNNAQVPVQNQPPPPPVQNAQAAGGHV